MSLANRLSRRQIRGLERVGDVLVPGGGPLPPFSRAGCAEDAGRILAALPEGDLNDLKLLLGVLSFCPTFVIRALLLVARYDRFFPNVLGGKLRLILVGLKGIVMLPYYHVPMGPAGFKADVQRTLGFSVAIRSARDPQDEVSELIRNANPLVEDPE